MSAHSGLCLVLSNRPRSGTNLRDVQNISFLRRASPLCRLRAGRGASPRAMVAALNQPATSLESGVLTRANVHLAFFRASQVATRSLAAETSRDRPWKDRGTTTIATSLWFVAGWRWCNPSALVQADVVVAHHGSSQRYTVSGVITYGCRLCRGSQD